MLKKWIKRLVISLILCQTIIVHADDLALKNNAPAQYIVKQGDTIWSIACAFLKYPWQWSELYQANPELSHNPDKIYPGDILVLKPGFKNHAKLIRTGRSTLRLSPSMRTDTLEQAIQTIPFAEIKPFLQGMQLVDQNTVNQSPYIVALNGETKTGIEGQEAYIKGLPNLNFSDYFVYRPDKKLVDQSTKKIIGYQAKYLGSIRVVRYKEKSISVADILTSREEFQPGDRLLAVPPLSEPDDIMLREPKKKVLGRIVGTLGEENQKITQYQIAVTNLGLEQGLRKGDVLAVYRTGEKVPDPLKPECYKEFRKDWITLPNERIGEVIIFKLFANASIGLVIQSKKEIQPMDAITNP